MTWTKIAENDLPEGVKSVVGLWSEIRPENDATQLLEILDAQTAKQITQRIVAEYFEQRSFADSGAVQLLEMLDPSTSKRVVRAIIQECEYHAGLSGDKSVDVEEALKWVNS